MSYFEYWHQTTAGHGRATGKTLFAVCTRTSRPPVSSNPLICRNTPAPDHAWHGPVVFHEAPGVGIIRENQGITWPDSYDWHNWVVILYLDCILPVTIKIQTGVTDATSQFLVHFIRRFSASLHPHFQRVLLAWPLKPEHPGQTNPWLKSKRVRRHRKPPRVAAPAK